MVIIPGNHDSRNVSYVRFEELIGEFDPSARGRSHLSGAWTRGSRTSTMVVWTQSLPWIQGAVRRSRPTSVSSCCTITCCRCLAPAGSDMVYDAGDLMECLQRAGVNLVLSGHKHFPYAWRMENLFVVQHPAPSPPCAFEATPDPATT